jgi:vacuolar iron transporter family protein
MTPLDDKTRRIILGFQKNEITEYLIYKILARFIRNAENRAVMLKIADEELLHYNIWHKYSQEQVKPNQIKRWFYFILSVIFGITFSIKLMESGENGAQVSYSSLVSVIPEAEEIKNQEFNHENKLIGMIKEEKIKYLGSIVLGLNDALIEFTGSLAGFTFALQNSRLISLIGLIMGFSASLSMAASEYFSTKAESEERSPLMSAIYTGTVYVFTVFLLICPYLIFKNCYFALFLMIVAAILLIAVFNFYFSVVKEMNFKTRFLEMLMISASVSVLSFAIGIMLKKIFNIAI